MIQTKRREKTFELHREPVSYVLSIHLQNMVATFGRDSVKQLVMIVFPELREETKQRKTRKAG